MEKNPRQTGGNTCNIYDKYLLCIQCRKCLHINAYQFLNNNPKKEKYTGSSQKKSTKYQEIKTYSIFKKINLFIYLFIFLWLPWVFVAACRLSLVAASRGYSSLQCSGFSLWWLLCCGCTARALGAQASVVVAHGLSCSAVRGIFPDQGSNPCPLHWQADS